jgi:hypothetical protein
MAVLSQDFLGCYVQLKGVLRVSAWILCAPFVLVVIKLARKNQNYPNVAPTSKVVSEITELRNSDTLSYLPSWILSYCVLSDAHLSDAQT